MSHNDTEVDIVLTLIHGRICPHGYRDGYCSHPYTGEDKSYNYTEVVIVLGLVV